MYLVAGNDACCNILSASTGLFDLSICSPGGQAPTSVSPSWRRGMLSLVFRGALHPCLCLPSFRSPCGGVSALRLCLPSCAGIFTSRLGLPSPSLVDGVSIHARPFVAMPWPFTRSFAAAPHAPVYLLATTSRLRAWSHLVPRAPTPQA